MGWESSLKSSCRKLCFYLFVLISSVSSPHHLLFLLCTFASSIFLNNKYHVVYHSCTDFILFFGFFSTNFIVLWLFEFYFFQFFFFLHFIKYCASVSHPAQLILTPLKLMVITLWIASSTFLIKIVNYYFI